MYNPYEVEVEAKIAEERYQPLLNRRQDNANENPNWLAKIGSLLASLRETWRRPEHQSSSPQVCP